MKKIIFYNILLLLMVNSVILFSQSKYALVIGNSNYDNITNLDTAVNDAIAVAEAMENLGFEVELLTNGNFRSIDDALYELERKLSLNKDTIAFIYYAGHAVQSQEENFLIPVDADIKTDSYLKRDSISLQWIFNVFEKAENILNIVILDACHKNPFPWIEGKHQYVEGMYHVKNQLTGIYVVFSAQPGAISIKNKKNNSLFTMEFLKHINTPGLNITEIFQLIKTGVQTESLGTQIPKMYY